MNINKDTLYIFSHINNTNNRVSKYPKLSDNVGDDAGVPIIKKVINKRWVKKKTKCSHGPRCRCVCEANARVMIERIGRNGFEYYEKKQGCTKIKHYIDPEIRTIENYISRKGVVESFIEQGYQVDWKWRNGWNYKKFKRYLSNINEDDINTKYYFDFGYFLINAKKKLKVDFSNNPNIYGKRFY